MRTIEALPLEHLHPSPDYVSDAIRATGTWYEAAILEELDRRLPDRGTIVDAGAMIGNHTRFLALAKPHATVLAFEPFGPNLELLRANTADLANVVVRPWALSDRARLAVPMAADPKNLGHVAIIETDPWPQPGMMATLADAVALDAFELDDVTLLKVDVEWHEPQVLAGAVRTIERWRPLIVIEDWKHQYRELLPGYGLAVSWERAHQTFLYEPVPA